MQYWKTQSLCHEAQSSRFILFLVIIFEKFLFLGVHLSVDLQDRIFSRHRSGEGSWKFLLLLKIPINTVDSIIHKDCCRAGFLSKLSDWRRRALVEEVMKNHMVTVRAPEVLCEEDLPEGQPSLQQDGSISSVKDTRSLLGVCQKGT